MSNLNDRWAKCDNGRVTNDKLMNNRIKLDSLQRYMAKQWKNINILTIINIFLFSNTTTPVLFLSNSMFSSICLRPICDENTRIWPYTIYILSICFRSTSYSYHSLVFESSSLSLFFLFFFFFLFIYILYFVKYLFFEWY